MNLWRNTFTLLFLIASLVLSAVALAQTPAEDEELIKTVRKNLTLTLEERNWLQKHKTIRIGIDPTYQPYSFVTPAGTYEGIAPDFIRLIGDILDIKFKTVSGLDWPGIVAGAKNRSLDVIATAVVTPERKTFLDFTEIYIPTPLVIMSREDDPSITSPQSLDGKRVALVEGYSSSQRVMKEYPGIKVRSVTSPKEGLQAVSVGEADAFVGVLGVNLHATREAGLTNLRIAAKYDLNTNGQRFAVRNDWPELQSILDKTLVQIPLLRKRQIFDRWISARGMQDITSTGQTPPFQLTASEKAWLDKKGEISVGIMNAWPPMDYIAENGKPSGIGVDFIKSINQRLEGRLKIVAAPFSDNYDAVLSGKLDALMDITPRKDRKQLFEFTDPYVVVPHVIFARKEGPYFGRLSDLAGRTVGHEEGFFIGEVLKVRYPSVKTKEYANTSDALDALVKGEIDAYVGNRAVAMFIIHNELISNVVEHGKVSETISSNAIGMRKGETVLRDILQKALNSVTTKERRAILSGWVENQGDKTDGAIALTNEEWNWLENHKTIRVAIDNKFPPIEYLGSDGTFKGLSVDLMNRIAPMLGVKFVYDKSATWSETVSKMKERKLDMFSAAAETPDRRLFATFTQSYYSLPVMIFTHEDQPYTAGLEELRNKKVAVVKGFAIEEYVRDADWNLDLVTTDNVSEALNMLAGNQVDAYLGTVLVTSHFIRKEGYSTIHVSGQTPYRLDLRMAARNDWTILTSILGKALKHIDDTEKAAVLNKWIGLKAQPDPNYRLVWQISIGATVIIILFLFWNYYLQRRMQAQSGQLAEQNKALKLEVEERQKAVMVADTANKAKSRFLANMSHELRTPLNAVIGFAEMMDSQMFGEMPERYRDYSSLILKSGKDLLDTVSQILDMSHIEAGKLEMVFDNIQVDLIVTDVLRIMTPLALEKKIGLINTVPGGLNIHADNLRTRQTLYSIIGNAIKFTSKGEVTVSASQGVDGVVISVKDTGVGMTTEEIDNVLHPFEQVEDTAYTRQTEGSGLGLALTQGLMELQHGNMEIMSTPGAGTEVRLTFPAGVSGDY